MAKYYEVKVDGLFIKASSKERAVKIFKNKFSKQQLHFACAFVDNTYTKEDVYNLEHLGCFNWPNCDTEGCGPVE